MLQSIRSIGYRAQDLLVIRLTAYKRLLASQHGNTGKSDSQNTAYESSLSRIIKSERKLNRFRRIHAYRVIVETVSYGLGLEYINRINSLRNFDSKQVALAELNDTFGLPRIFKYKNYGKFSPTTLRYISVSLEIQKLFPDLNQATIAEVGVGYGGQASILLDQIKVKRYDLFDLSPALAISKEYLSRVGKLKGIKFSSLDRVEGTNWDLVISNYAFSELPRALQIEYIQKVFLRSKRGYLIMNSGFTDFTGRNPGKLSQEEIRDLIPGVEIIPEVPNSGPDNYLIIWGHDTTPKP